MKSEQNAGHWRDVIERLRLDRADAVAAELAAARDSGAAALPATLGDKQAAARLAEADQREAAAGRLIKQLDAAIEDASGQLRAVEQAQREAEAAARLEAARGIAVEVLALDNDEIDPLLVRLGQALARRGELVRSLGAHGQLDGTRNRKLRNQTMLLASLHAAGLQHHLPLARVPPHHWTSLAGWDARWLSSLLPAGSAPPPPPPSPPPPSDPELTEAQWEEVEERQARRLFA